VRAAREQERTRKMATCLSAGNVMIVKALDSWVAKIVEQEA
jgi:hypothetical protein